MLTESDFRILSALRSPQSITELSTTTDYSPGYVSERVAHLEEYDLVTTSRQTRAKHVRAFHTPILETYRTLATTNPHIDLPSLISPSMLRVCWFLDTPTPVSQMESWLTLRRRRIYQLLEQLQTRGLITKHDNKYVLTDDLQGLADLAQTVIAYDHQHRAQTHLPTAAVVWSAPHEALVTSTEDAADTMVDAFDDQEDWLLTGLPRFEDHDLEFFIAGPPPYFYSELRDTLQPVDFISHTLLLETDTRHLSYCALLLFAIDVSVEELRTVATYYGIEETVEALITFVETKGDIRREDVRFPDWSEMTSLAAQYEVSV